MTPAMHAADSAPGAAPRLLARYDRPGPRYTSYPTAVEFHDGFDARSYLARLVEASRRPEEPLSVYVHLPFCRHRCSFCGCNVIITRRPELVDAYLDDLEREIDLVADRLGRRNRLVQYHWGGGTPTFLSVAQMRRLHGIITRRFRFAPRAELAIEVDPRATTPAQAELLAELGFNRISMGVQDFDVGVQAAVHRHQTFTQTRDLYEVLRGLGFSSINFDLIYGLPRQTAESFRRTVELVSDLHPDRIAVYSYAFVPWIKGHQKAVDPEALPSRETKFELFGIAQDLFEQAGYQMIGMDHFAVRGDPLAEAAREGTLFRNFMGYTTHAARDFIGFGVSAIGDLGGAFAQNTRDLARYHDALARGLPPVERGYHRSHDDEIRRDVIQELMCHSRLVIGPVEKRHGITFGEYFAPALAELDQGPMADGLVRYDGVTLEVTAAGRRFLRNICMAFDAYRQRGTAPANPVFSRTI